MVRQAVENVVTRQAVSLRLPIRRGLDPLTMWMHSDRLQGGSCVPLRVKNETNQKSILSGSKSSGVYPWLSCTSR